MRSEIGVSSHPFPILSPRSVSSQASNGRRGRRTVVAKRDPAERFPRASVDALIALPRMPKIGYTVSYADFWTYGKRCGLCFMLISFSFLDFWFRRDFLLLFSSSPTSGATMKEGRKRRLSRALKAPNPTVSHTLILSAGNFHPFFKKTLSFLRPVVGKQSGRQFEFSPAAVIV